MHIKVQWSESTSISLPMRVVQSLVAMQLSARFAAATCCGSYALVDNTALLGQICLDGLWVDGWFCGVGECNTFGCNCDGGCRSAYWHECMDNCKGKVVDNNNNCRKVCDRNPVGNDLA